MKTVLIVIVLLALLGVGGFLYLNNQSKSQLKPAVNTKAPAQAAANAFTSIKDALSKSLSLKCDYKGDNGVEYSTYIKGGSVRVTSLGSKDQAQMEDVIMNGTKAYMWNDSTKKGFTYNLTMPKITPGKITPVKTAVTGTQTTDKSDAVLSQIEKYKDSCKTFLVPDSMFTPPKDVTFQDYTEMMNKVMQGLPSTTPGQGNTQDYQKYMQDFTKQIQNGQ